MAGPDGWQDAVRSVVPLFHDPRPEDLAISGAFLLVTCLALATALRRALPWNHRLRWGAVAGLLTLLLVNQQGDLHARLLSGAKDVAQENRALLPDLPVSLLGLAALAAIVSLLIGAILVLATGQGPPGPWAAAGLLLLLAHATGRAVTFADLLPNRYEQDRVHLYLKAVEVAGLAFIALAALRYRPDPVRDGDVWEDSTRSPQSAPGPSLLYSGDLDPGFKGARPAEIRCTAAPLPPGPGT